MSSIFFHCLFCQSNFSLNLCTPRFLPLSTEEEGPTRQWGILLGCCSPSSGLSVVSSYLSAFPPPSASLSPPITFSLSLFNISVCLSLFCREQSWLYPSGNERIHWARTSQGVSRYCSQRFYLSSLQVSLLPTKCQAPDKRDSEVPHFSPLNAE